MLFIYLCLKVNASLAAISCIPGLLKRSSSFNFVRSYLIANQCIILKLWLVIELKLLKEKVFLVLAFFSQLDPFAAVVHLLDMKYSNVSLGKICNVEIEHRAYRASTQDFKDKLRNQL